jgi:hypothetical protein
LTAADDDFGYAPIARARFALGALAVVGADGGTLFSDSAPALAVDGAAPLAVVGNAAPGATSPDASNIPTRRRASTSGVVRAADVDAFA